MGKTEKSVPVYVKNEEVWEMQDETFCVGNAEQS